MTTLQSIPLNRLVHSAANVRRTGRGASLEGLMTSLETHGLRQNLNVKPTSGNRFEVVAGGRRLEALRRLAKAGRIEAKLPVPCLVLEEGQNPLEVSLAENAMRTDMHPDDQCEAFAGLIAGGMPAEDVAARFGVTPAVVAQRLKLAGVSPVLRKKFRQGDLTLAQMMALALSDDHAQQEKVMAELPDWDNDPRAIRARLTEEGLPATHRLCRFVGEEAFAAAGGGVLRDLFETEHAPVWTDGDLVRRLAMEKLDGIAAGVKAEGWGWVRTSLESAYEPFGELEPEGEQDGEPIFTAEQMAGAGAKVTLNYAGELSIERALVERRPKAEVAKAEDEQEGAATEYPATMVAELTAQRTLAIRLELAKRPDLGLAVLVHALASRLLFGRTEALSCLTMSARSQSMDTAIRTPEDGSAQAAFAQLTQEARARLPGDPEALWDWCVEADRERLVGLLAVLTALMVDAQTVRVDARSGAMAHADQIARAVSLDMRQHWTPTAAGFFGRLTKPMLARIVAEEGNGLQADAIGKMKRDEAAAKVAAALEPRSWLPQILRTVAETDA